MFFTRARPKVHRHLIDSESTCFLAYKDLLYYYRGDIFSAVSSLSQSANVTSRREFQVSSWVFDFAGRSRVFFLSCKWHCLVSLFFEWCNLDFVVFPNDYDQWLIGLCKCDNIPKMIINQNFKDMQRRVKGAHIPSLAVNSIQLSKEARETPKPSDKQRWKFTHEERRAHSKRLDDS